MFKGGRTEKYCGAGFCVTGGKIPRRIEQLTDGTIDCKVPYDKVSKDGTCGPAFNNLICGEREWGPCCSVYGRCWSYPSHTRLLTERRRIRRAALRSAGLR